MSNIYAMPNSGSWDAGRFVGSVRRIDGDSSGVVLDMTHASSLRHDAQAAIVNTATCLEDLLKAPGAMRFSDYMARILGVV